jgi:hypothetical protein
MNHLVDFYLANAKAIFHLGNGNPKAWHSLNWYQPSAGDINQTSGTFFPADSTLTPLSSASRVIYYAD